MATQERNCRFYAIVRGRKVGIVACSGASAVTDVDPFVSNFPRGLVKHFRTWEEAQNFLDGENTPVKFRISTPGLKYPITKEVSVPCTEPVGDVLDRILAEGELGGRPTNGFEISLPSGEGSAITLETAAGAIPGRTPVVNVQMLENQTESKKHKRTSWTLQILGLPSSSK
uniref:Uncharacterized protein n=1 Tax=Chromera velia CCMP2878 TaxID=1169474 RepID=A0A0G4HTF0_9ALVE|eukprot:Cvel_8479.t1-p1 / transcript=Cvel_8479.t1 / gene=Cvel_8479 / organism=Chromera_velia_CCMP2878 / gene_product=hypothetical protein / transcript_product=hypothetical protein / location=Cvel_scaffold468:54852-55361(-) / protein_length=170 / sequence_SO=supercontig / SO=protein_coding / is_pseudo=false